MYKQQLSKDFMNLGTWEGLEKVKEGENDLNTVRT